MLVPQQAQQAMLSPLMIFILLLILPLIPLAIYQIHKGSQPGYRRQGDPWACGYGWEPSMAMSAGNFTQPLRVMFAGLYRLRRQLDPSPGLRRALERAIQGAGRVEPFWDDCIINPLVRFTQRFGGQVQVLQGGDFRIYCLYVVAALVILLLITAV
jgi:hydrogenase-4 component B